MSDERRSTGRRGVLAFAQAEQGEASAQEVQNLHVARCCTCVKAGQSGRLENAHVRLPY